MSENKIVVHHYPCPDGELSAAIFNKKFSNCTFIPWIHELKNNNIEIIKNKINELNSKSSLFFLDYCPDFETALVLSKKVSKLNIFDHHMAACDKFEEQYNDHIKNDSGDLNISLTFDNKKSGCQITWDYCYNGKKYPESVKHIGNRDIWIWEDENTEPFTSAYPLHYNLKSDITPEERLKIFSKILSCQGDELNKIIENGKSIIQKMKNECFQLLPLVRTKVDFDINDKLLRIIEVPMSKYHLTKYIQELVKDKYPEYDVLRLLYEKDKMNVYSLRSLKDNVRVDLLAQKYGGNGHMKASGYNINI